MTQADEDWRSELQRKLRKGKYEVKALEVAHDACVTLLEYTQSELDSLAPRIIFRKLVVTAVRRRKEVE